MEEETKLCYKTGEAENLHSLQDQIEKALLPSQTEKAEANSSSYLTGGCLYN